jgi:hypothetical protein
MQRRKVGMESDGNWMGVKESGDGTWMGVKESGHGTWNASERGREAEPMTDAAAIGK